MVGAAHCVRPLQSDIKRRARESPTKDDVVAELAALEKPLRQRGLTSLALFGSVVRGAARPGSDIGLLVDVTPDSQFRAAGYSVGEFELTLDCLKAHLAAKRIEKRIGLQIFQTQIR
jgi:predicted nucleotidyltransferase